MRPGLHRSWLFPAILAVLAGCADGANVLEFDGPSPGAAGRLTVALEQAPLPALAFQARLYRNLPVDPKSRPYYESPCATLGTGFSINHLEERKGYVLVLDAYSSGDCSASTRVARGVRGDIEVLAEGTGKAIYFVQLNGVGLVTEMPMPPASLLDSGVSCTADVDCQGLEDCTDETRADCFQEACLPTEECEGGLKWVRLRVHPAALCIEGRCRLDNLHPLNGRWPRAFHVAAAAPDGVVRVFGGFQAATEATLTTSTRALSETFDSGRFLFEEQDLGASLGQASAAMATARTANGRLLTFGGTSVLGNVSRGNVQVPDFRTETCIGAACVVTPSKEAYAVDLATGTVTRSVMEFQGAGGVAMGIAGPGALVRPGVVSGEGNRQVVGRGAWRCLLAEDDTISCLEFPGSENAVARLSATIACIDGTRESCNGIVVLGGNVRTAPVGELYQVAENRFVNLASVGSVPETLDGAVAVEAGGQVWTFGGRTSDSIDAPPYAFNVDPRQGTLSAQAAGLPESDLAILKRVGHQATPLGDGKRVLITGGVGPDGKVRDQAVLVEANAGSLSVVARIPMAPRAFHQAVVIEGGLFDGSVLISGGMKALQGTDRFAGGAAFYLP